LSCPFSDFIQRNSCFSQEVAKEESIKMINLREVTTKEMVLKCLEVSTEQTPQTTENAAIFALAWIERDKIRPLCIYYNDTMIGFVILHCEGDLCEAQQFVIDRNHQGKGYELEASRAIMNYVENNLKSKQFFFFPTLPTKTIVTESKKDVDLELEITKVLQEIGIPAHIKGYSYLRCAITKAYHEFELLSKITKTIYPEIAKEYETTPARVERAIRHAIEIAWSLERNAIVKFFGTPTTVINKQKPGNAAFIATIADRLRLQHRDKPA